MTTAAPAPAEGALLRLLRLWFTFDVRVDRRAYVLSGVGLMVTKYVVEALLVYGVTRTVWQPMAFFSPVYMMRAHQVDASQTWLFAVLGIMTLPFLWIGVSMSVRRAVDGGISAWVGVLFLVPLISYCTMLVLAFLPSKAGAVWQPTPSPASAYRRGGPQPELPVAVDSSVKSALLGVAAAAIVGLAMVGISVYGFGAYGAALFFVTPFVMGAVSGFLYNRPYHRSVGSTLLVALASTVLAASAMMLFALEGLVCLLMAAPIAAVIALFGSLVGRAIAIQTATPLSQTAAMVLILPGLAGAEAKVLETPLHEVVSFVEIDAPPEHVWPNVIGFSELDPPSELMFHTGIAYPMRARIEGSGVGAVRHCEFSTGPFVEPITTWDPPRRLSFDVSKQPPAMEEWSPFTNVHPPHLDGSIRSKHGEFRLIPLAGGRTRLEGSTWYELSMAPAAYWQAWSDTMIHAIHTRVLTHVKGLSERATHGG